MNEESNRSKSVLIAENKALRCALLNREGGERLSLTIYSEDEEDLIKALKVASYLAFMEEFSNVLRSICKYGAWNDIKADEIKSPMDMAFNISDTFWDLLNQAGIAEDLF